VHCHLVAWLYNILYFAVFQRMHHTLMINNSGVFVNGVPVAVGEDVNMTFCHDQHFKKIVQDQDFHVVCGDLVQDSYEQCTQLNKIW